MDQIDLYATLFSTRYRAVTQLRTRVIYQTRSLCCPGYTGDGQHCTRQFSHIPCIHVYLHRTLSVIFFVKMYDISAVCEGCTSPGMCVSPGVCECPVGWTGSQCSEG